MAIDLRQVVGRALQRDAPVPGKPCPPRCVPRLVATVARASDLTNGLTYTLSGPVAYEAVQLLRQQAHPNHGGRRCLPSDSSGLS